MQEKYGFVYIWFDKKHKRYYVGSRWGTIDDGYICSSRWMMKAYKRRPQDFTRKVLSKIYTNRKDLLLEEQRYFDMIKPEEIKIRYYNLCLKATTVWHTNEDSRKTIGQKISASKKGKSTGPCSPETAAKISKSNKGRVFTEEHKKKLREKKLGKKLTPEHRLKVIQTLKYHKELNT